MPGSVDTFNEAAKRIIKEINPISVFDIGVGAGKYGRLTKEVCPKAHIYGVEVDSTYLKDPQFKASQDLYAQIQNIDFRELIKTWECEHDLFIFGDVLEHFFRSEVFDCLDFCLSRCKYIMCLIPLGCRQGVWQGHNSERHISEISLQDLAKYDIVEYQKKEYGDKNHGGFDYQLILIRGFRK